MDTLRGQFSDPDGATTGFSGDDDDARDRIVAPVGQDERRMQVRAYNFWASLLEDRPFPDIAQLHPETLPDFGPNSVLLDFSAGIENPAVAWLGAELAGECGALGAIHRLDDVPSRSLLSRITDHYMQILANQAPIGFEAEFVNQRGATILYRGILLPFSRGHDAIDCIYGVINWKQLADQSSTDMLMRAVDETLGEPGAELGPLDLPPRREALLGEWADGPVEQVLSLTDRLPPVAFGGEGILESPITLGSGVLDLDRLDADVLELTADMELADWLASARELARAAMGSEDRSRQALYAALGRAYDFALAAADAPQDLAALVEDAGLKVQDRAPLVPLVKLVFGTDYDKTRLTEFAAVLAHGMRLGLECGRLAAHIAGTEGGIKALVRDERRLRRAEGEKESPSLSRHERLVRGLRGLSPRAEEEIGRSSEFTVLVARRDEHGELRFLGEVSDDEALLRRAARHLLG
ncbi:MAG: hypothetical protein E2586_03365 [Novosphingobium sp.]|uniref:hypothetical protein n=1 Tax=Novosphingobium sp. TaxID=1874826 RepID=UPI0012CD61BA|nr:hypothetical protein [Novosphingobium sp.]MPS67517.1 hypothetical protein [Novosphingobium sp.]